MTRKVASPETRHRRPYRWMPGIGEHGERKSLGKRNCRHCVEAFSCRNRSSPANGKAPGPRHPTYSTGARSATTGDGGPAPFEVFNLEDGVLNGRIP